MQILWCALNFETVRGGGSSLGSRSRLEGPPALGVGVGLRHSGGRLGGTQVLSEDAEDGGQRGGTRRPLIGEPGDNLVPQAGGLRPHDLKTRRVSCVQGTARSRINMVACHRDTTVAVASDHYWGSTLLLDYHAPLLFTRTHPVVRLDRPHLHTVTRTPEHHLGPVALSPVEEANFRASVIRRRDSNPPIAQVR